MSLSVSLGKWLLRLGTIEEWKNQGFGKTVRIQGPYRNVAIDKGGGKYVDDSDDL